MIAIYQYRNAIDFLNAEFAARKRKNARYSLRAFSKSLGLDEAASLSQALGRKRSLSQRVINLIKEKLFSSDADRSYFEIICAAADAPDDQTRLFYEKLAHDFKPAHAEVKTRLEQFQCISQWYHFVILEMTNLPTFREDVDWIADRLCGKVSKRDVRTALVRLLELGYLRRDEKGRLFRAEPYLETHTDVPSVALRQMHRDLIGLAQDALQTQPIDQRDITAFNTISSHKRIQGAKKMIAEFRKELMRYLEDPEGDTVLQVNVQMFDLLPEMKS